MNIINVTFTSINANKSSTPKGEINITNNVKLDSMTEAKMGLDKTNTALKIGYTYTTDYSPEFAKIEVKGEIIVLEEASKATQAMKAWTKDKGKGLDQKFAAFVLTNIMNRCALEAIILAKELSLPSPIPMPTINIGEGKPKKAEKPAKKK